MKRTKKLLALVLAMVMAFSLMAVTAAAYGAEEHEHTHVCSTETIQPRIPAPQCPECSGSMSAGKTTPIGEGKYRTTYRCNNKNCDGTVTLDWWA